MKLRSHEILTTHVNSPGLSTKSASRFKQLFQRKNLFKKKPSPPIPTAPSLAHGIPDYVRKSILRFLLEPSVPVVQQQQQSPSRHVRPPVMGVQALKNKKQQSGHPAKRSLRTRAQPGTGDESKKTLEEPVPPTNYDMTILHMNIDDESDDDSDDNTMFATHTSTQQRKAIPQWARKNELQIAICNQLYFQRNPSEIFGHTNDCSPAHLRTLLHSMLPNVQLLDDDLHPSPSMPINSNKSILV